MSDPSPKLAQKIRDASAPPWPDVPECHSKHIAGHSCPQCDGSHEHHWRAWRDAPDAAYGIPVRCLVCGGRKCDRPACMLQRHHGGDHVDY